MVVLALIKSKAENIIRNRLHLYVRLFACMNAGTCSRTYHSGWLTYWLHADDVWNTASIRESHAHDQFTVVFANDGEAKRLVEMEGVGVGALDREAGCGVTIGSQSVQ